MSESHLPNTPGGPGSSEGPTASPPIAICNDHCDLFKACKKEVFNTRHNKCAEHMDCIQFDPTDGFTSCMYAPSTCKVCSLIIHHMDIAISSDDKTRRAEARTNVQNTRTGNSRSKEVTPLVCFVPSTYFIRI